MELPRHLLGKYIEHRKRDFKDCLHSLKRHEYKNIEKVGHQLKGNGATFGHPELSSIGKKLEEAAQEQDVNTLEKSMKEFSDWVKNLH
jgi:HPt (histidine-containing phosphotransfer) domain-containing protein